MRVYQYIIKGKPMACPRPRATRQGRVYMPKEYNRHKKNLILQFIIQGGLQCSTKITEAAHVDITFVYPRPKYLKGEELQVKTTKPDIDNLVKTILDALTGAAVWSDDNLVVSLSCSKFYGPPDYAGQTEIKITSPWRSTNE